MNTLHEFNAELKIGKVSVDGTILWHADEDRYGGVTTYQVVIDNIIIRSIGKRVCNFDAACNLRDRNFGRLVDEAYAIINENL